MQPSTFHFQFSARRMLLPSIGAQHLKKACTGRFLRRLCLFLIFHKGSQIAHRADPLQVVIRPFDAEFLLQGKHQITEIRPSPDPPASRCLALRGSRRMPAAHKEIRGSFQKPWITPPPCELPATSIQALTGKCKRQAHGIRQKFPLRIGRCFQPARTSTFRTPST